MGGNLLVSLQPHVAREPRLKNGLRPLSAALAASVLLAACGVLETPESKYDKAFPKKERLSTFYLPVKAKAHGISIQTRFSLDTAANPVSWASYRFQSRAGIDGPWDKDTVEICSAAGCSRTLIDLLGHDSTTQWTNAQRVIGLLWKGGRLWAAKRWKIDWADTLFEVDLAGGRLDYSKPDLSVPPIPDSLVKDYGLPYEPLSGAVVDPQGFRYSYIRFGAQGYAIFAATLSKTDAAGNAVWSRHVPMAPMQILWHDGSLYLGGISGARTRSGEDTRAKIMKIAPDSQVVWEREYHAADTERRDGITSLRVDGQGHLIALGYSGVDETYLYCLRAELTGEPISERIFAVKPEGFLLSEPRILHVGGGVVRMSLWGISSEPSIYGWAHAYGELPL